jgi:small subunit ribosomal protein S20
MPNHKSTWKRMRSSATRRLRNKYYAKTMRNAIRAFKSLKDPDEAKKQFDDLASQIDKLAKRKILHPNNAAHKKAGLAKHISFISNQS